MTEKEYTNTKALGTVTAGINVLKDLVPQIMPHIIHDKEWTRVMGTLYNWQERLFKQNEIDELSEVEKVNKSNKINRFEYNKEIFEDVLDRLKEAKDKSYVSVPLDNIAKLKYALKNELISFIDLNDKIQTIVMVKPSEHPSLFDESLK